MPKYFETKKDSLEQAVLEAMSPAQQAAIAISKKEKGEKPKDEKDEGNAFGKAVMSAKKAGKKEFVFAGKKYNTEDQLDPVNKDAVKKKFKDRKDKDIDNDGDVDSTDKYLHKRRKAISKAVKEQNQTLVQMAANEITKMWEKSANVKVVSDDDPRYKDDENLKKKMKKEDDEDEEEPKNGKKTMTGKPMSKVETSPKDKIEK